MKIGELAARASLNASAIRYYEKLGLLAPPQRIGGQRRYPSDALQRVLLIRFATDMGFTLAEIKLLLSGLLRCHCPSLQICVNRLSLSPKLRLLENIPD